VGGVRFPRHFMMDKISQADQDKHNRKIQIQNKQYSYPYHHIPHFLEDGTAIRIRTLHWGFGYLSCLKEAKETVESWNPSSVLDVGCGDGAILASLSPDIKKRVGVDLCEEAIRFAQGFSPDLEFHVMNAAELQETFDVVMAVEVLEHIPDHEVIGFLRILSERTKPGGYIYLSVPSNNIPVNKKHFRHYDPDLLKEEIQAAEIQFDIISLRYFGSPARFEEVYERLTNNRLWIGEIHPLRRYIWKKVWSNAKSPNSKTARHIIMCLKKRD
jgi:2-polyprenyl-3-methyl-5-hydroxy-6-metoxy-1,4-benzoquinol methylase